METASGRGEGETLKGPRLAATTGRLGQLDLPGVLPVVLLAGTWELLLVRVVTLAARTAESEAEPWLVALAKVGAFAQYLAVILALVLLAEAVVALVRDSSFGPITHRVTIAGFAAITIAVCAGSTVMRLGSEPSLMAHAAAVLLSLLLVLGLLWHRIGARILVGAVLLLVPTLLRFYASCAISVPLLRTESPVPLYAYHGAEVVAVGTALAAPFLFSGLGLRDLTRRSSLIAMGLASLPAVALAAAMAGSTDQVRHLVRVGAGFEMVIPPAQLVYPLALFAFLLAVALLVLPGFGAPRSRDHQRLGYGLGLLFLAGLDGLEGAVLSVGAGPSDVPDLVAYLLDGSWSHMTADQQGLVGPPLRDLYRVILLALGYVVIARGIHGLARGRPGRGGSAPEEAP